MIEEDRSMVARCCVYRTLDDPREVVCLVSGGSVVCTLRGRSSARKLGPEC